MLLNGFKLLIVDDEELIVENLKSYFELEDIEVHYANGAFEALEICENEQFNLIISDVRMPKGNGIDLLKGLNEKNENPKPKVILMSGFTQISKEEALRLGALDLISKPINFDLLDELIQKYFN